MWRGKGGCGEGRELERREGRMEGGKGRCGEGRDVGGGEEGARRGEGCVEGRGSLRSRE